MAAKKKSARARPSIEKAAAKTARKATKKTTAKKSAPRRTAKHAPKTPAAKGGTKKNSLVANINRRKRNGTSRPKRAGSITKESYDEMEKGWPRANAKKRASRPKIKSKGRTSRPRAKG